MNKEILHAALPESWREWEIIEEIGTGSYGTVYKAKHRSNDEMRAVKILEIPGNKKDADAMVKTLGNEESARSYYLNLVMDLHHEIRTLEELKSADNIVRIEDSHVSENRDSIGWKIFILMEYLNDFAQDEFLEMEAEADVLKLGIDICTALEMCEKNGIVHRDIKPENILVDDHGNYKLCDFGVAKNMERTTSIHSVQGTFSYMCPETYHGRQSTNQADIYSLGLILYQLMNKRRLPFLDIDKQLIYFRDKQDALGKRMEGHQMPAPVAASEGFAEIILKACEYDTEARYKSASDLKKDLQALLDGRYKLRKRKGQKKKVELVVTRKILQRVLVACCLVILLAAGVFAAKHIYNENNVTDRLNFTVVESGQEVKSLCYELTSSGTLTVKGGTSEDGDFASIDVGEDPYFNLIEDKSKVKELVIEDWTDDTIRTDFNEIFPSLRSVVIKAEIKELGNGSFWGCNLLEKVSLPESLEKIGRLSFQGCKRLDSLVIPASVKSIGAFAFSECLALDELIVPDGVTKLDKSVVEGCRDEIKVSLPKGIKITNKYNVESNAEFVER